MTNLANAWGTPERVLSNEKVIMIGVSGAWFIMKGVFSVKMRLPRRWLVTKGVFSVLC